MCDVAVRNMASRTPVGARQQSACPRPILQVQAGAPQPGTQGHAPNNEQGRSLSAAEGARAASQDVWATEGHLRTVKGLLEDVAGLCQWSCRAGKAGHVGAATHL